MTISRIGIGLAAAVAALLPSSSPAAAAEDAAALVKRAFAVKGQSSDARMVIHLPGESANREFRLQQRKTTEDERVRIDVFAPYNYKEVRYLFIERPSDKDEHHTYLPAFRRVQRITGEHLDAPFLATLFYLRDLVPPDIDQQTHTFVGEETIAGRACKIVESIAAASERRLYGKRRIAIDPTDELVVRIEFFDQKGALLKTWSVDRFEKVDGVWTPREQTMKAPGGEEWKLRIDEIEYGVDIDNSSLTPISLSSG